VCGRLSSDSPTFSRSTRRQRIAIKVRRQCVSPETPESQRADAVTHIQQLECKGLAHRRGVVLEGNGGDWGCRVSLGLLALCFGSRGYSSIATGLRTECSLPFGGRFSPGNTAM
jgi:hypothetical protein